MAFASVAMTTALRAFSRIEGLLFLVEQLTYWKNGNAAASTFNNEHKHSDLKLCGDFFSLLQIFASGNKNVKTEIAKLLLV